MDGWFVFVVVAGIVLCSGFVISIVMLKSAWAKKEREVLTSYDLRVLEESVVVLIDQLKTEMDGRIAEAEIRAKALEQLLHEADERIIAYGRLVQENEAKACVARQQPPSAGLVEDLDGDRLHALISNGADPVQLARTLGVDCAELKLMQRLSSMRN